MHLSDVYKFTQGLGQKGHQIGRKVGDAIELLTLGMIHQEEELTRFLEIEDGVEGATSAKHKVEFSFYNLNDRQKPSKVSEELFGIIECKKVGVEQTIKQSFKKWKTVARNKRDFHLTDGYGFTISPSYTDFRWQVSVASSTSSDANLNVTVVRISGGEEVGREERSFMCGQGQQILVAIDTLNQLYVIGPGEMLSSVEGHVSKCVVIEVVRVVSGRVKAINVNDSLPGPQTPEKAKQASFVSLDVRKKVLGRFDKSDDLSFISILVIGEASHWEDKSRSMVRLCNDYNLVIPDGVLVRLFSRFEQDFGIGYQQRITKTAYRNDAAVKAAVSEIIAEFNNQVLQDMSSGDFVRFRHATEGGRNLLRIVPVG